MKKKDKQSKKQSRIQSSRMNPIIIQKSTLTLSDDTQKNPNKNNNNKSPKQSHFFNESLFFLSLKLSFLSFFSPCFSSTCRQKKKGVLSKPIKTKNSFFSNPKRITFFSGHHKQLQSKFFSSWPN